MYTERAGKIAKLEEMLDKDVYVICHNRRNSAYIDGTMIDVFRRMIKFSKRRDGAALVIQTPGGSLDESYYIGEFFREYYDYTESYVVSDCYSGGTIIALSTDKIFLSRSGCLGPIDIQYYMPSKENTWFPALTGTVEALAKAEEDGKITENMRKYFHNKMDVLAMYFKEYYTYRELIGKNVKKHCLVENEWEKVWDYLAALNISHGTPLTYRKTQELGLNVEIMADEVDKVIKSIIYDVEHNEFGDLKEKSVLYDFFNGGLPGASGVTKGNSTVRGGLSQYVDKEKKEKKKSRNILDEHEYCLGKNNEKLAIIETSVVGFAQNREVGIAFEDLVPVFLTVLSNGWEEELDTSSITDEQRKNLETVVGYIADIATSEMEWDTSELGDQEYNEVLNKTYNNLSAMAVSELKNKGYEIEDITSSKLYSMIVEYLTETPELIGFDEIIEPKLSTFATACGLEYDKLGAADKINLYYDFYDIVLESMLKVIEISEEEFNELSVSEQDKMVIDFMCEAEIEFTKSEE